MTKAENIVAFIMSDLVADGMRDRIYQKTFDLIGYNYKVIKEAEEILKLFLQFSPIIVVGDWENNNTLGGLYKITIMWDSKNTKWGDENEN